MATSKAIAAYRGARAVELAVAGWSYDDITQELGYKSRGSVSKALWKTIERRSAAAVDAFRERELQRLDALERAHWGKALAGSAAVAEVVLGVVEKRIRLLGLERGPDPSQGPADVVDPVGQGGKPVRERLAVLPSPLWDDVMARDCARPKRC